MQTLLKWIKRILSQEIDIKKNYMETLELKNSIRSRMEMTERGISELEDRLIEILHAKQQREKKIGEKMSWASGDCEKIAKCPTLMSLESQEAKECGTETIFKEILAENFPINEWYKLTDSRSSVNPKQDKFNEIYTQTHHNQTAEN